MKGETRLYKVILAVLSLFLFLPGIPGHAAAETEKRQMTIMVYMCGSNLESSSGAASADIFEMMEAMPETTDISLLIMTGGTDSWQIGYDPQKTSIHEIRGGKQRIVWSADSLDMGDGKTLTTFLQYGKEHYPADRYSLIIWNHGAGPLGGVCWDELFQMSHMPLRDLKNAIRTGMGREKLNWIGFDACLMSTLEVAVEMSSVAEIMIASQETEPAHGWNYAFLKSLVGDEEPAEIGRRIIDAYFEGQDHSREILTLACIDLEKAAEAAETLGSYFAKAERTISTDSFPQLSGQRQAATSFGKSVRSATEDSGYDLVDAKDLITRMKEDDRERENVLAALDAAVIYSRANVRQANGLTIYHPYYNKSRYISEWKESYQQMNLIRGYTRYVQSFGSLLTGEELVRWTRLQPRAEERTTNGEYRFSLQLTEEQAAHFAAGKLMIIGDSGQNALSGATALYSVTQAEIDRNGVIRGTYDQDSIYVETESGDLIGPLGYQQTEDGNFIVISATYVPKEENGNSEAIRYIHFFLDAWDRSAHPQIIRTQVWDDSTGSYSNRLMINKERYRMIIFRDFMKIYPGVDEGTLPDYYLWEDSGSIQLKGLALPNQWKFTRRKEQMTNTQLYAMFEITDVQQNIRCSEPVPIENPNQAFFTVKSGTIRSHDCDITLTGYINLTAKPGVHLFLTAENMTDRDRRLQIQEIILNDERETDCAGRIEMKKKGTTVQELDVRVDDLAGMEEIQTITFLIKEEDAGNEKIETVVFRVEKANIRTIVPTESTGEATQSQIRMEILQIQPTKYGGFEVTTLIENRSGKPVKPKALILNDYQIDTGGANVIQAGKSRVVTWQWNNSLDVSSVQMNIPDKKYSSMVILDHLMALHGQDQIRKISLLYSNTEDSRDSENILTVVLKDAWEIREDTTWRKNHIISYTMFPAEAEDAAGRVILAENERFSVQMRQMIIGTDSIVFAIEIINRTDTFLGMNIRDISLNDGEINYNPMSFHRGSWVSIPPGVTMGKTIALSKNNGIQPGMEIRSISMLIHEFDTRPWTPAMITLKNSITTKEADIQWIKANQITVKQGQMPDENNKDRMGIGIETEILMPDNAASYRHWIEAPLSEEEMKTAESGRLVLIQPTRNAMGDDAEDSWATVIMVMDLTQNDKGKWGAMFPGLLPAADSESEGLIPLRIIEISEEQMLANLVSPFEISNSDYTNAKTFQIKARMIVDYKADLANMIEIETGAATGYSPMQSWEFKCVTWYTLVVDTGKESRGKYPGYSQMETVDILTGWQEKLNGEPLRIRMRALTASDEIIAVFDIFNQDGSEYSLMMPFMDLIL